MTIKHIMEVLNNTPPAVTPAERLVLIAIAEKAHKDTRECWPGLEKLMRHTGLTRTGLQQAFRRLSARGLEVRIAVAKDKDGRPVYAYRGKQTRYRLPELPELSPPIREDSESDSDPTEGLTTDTPYEEAKGSPDATQPSEKGLTVVTDPPRKGSPQIPKGLTTDSPKPLRTLKEQGQPSNPFTRPAMPDDADDVIDAEVIDLDPGADLDLFGDPIEPPPAPSPVPVIVAMYIDAVRSTEGVATSTMIGAIGKNAKRLIDVDKIHPAVVAVAAQRAGERRAKVLDPFLGAAQSSYNRHGDSRRALFAAWQKMHDGAVAENNASNPQPINKQIGQ